MRRSELTATPEAHPSVFHSSAAATSRLFTQGAGHLGTFVRRAPSLLSSIALVLLVVAGTAPGGRLRLAIYALSFWHYYYYWLAYRWGAVPLVVFKRDAIAMKSVSLIALTMPYLAAGPNLLSVGVVAVGFLLNAVAARELGSDRTYYGHEVADLPRKHITAFPYSWISHPMLVGNMVAFGGTLIDADFRQGWWPLACGHMVMNGGLLLMERLVTPRRGQRHTPTSKRGARSSWPELRSSFCILTSMGGLLGWTAGSWRWWTIHGLPGAAIGSVMAAHAAIMYFCYSAPVFRPDERQFQGRSLHECTSTTGE